VRSPAASVSRHRLDFKAWVQCAFCRNCGTMKETKSLWEEPDAGHKPFEETLTSRDNSLRGSFGRARGLAVPFACGLNLHRARQFGLPAASFSPGSIQHPPGEVGGFWNRSFGRMSDRPLMVMRWETCRDQAD
jgi:hypothetical protein